MLAFVGSQITTTRVRISAWAYVKVISSFITFGGRSPPLAYHVHKSGRKTSIIIIIILWLLHVDGQVALRINLNRMTVARVGYPSEVIRKMLLRRVWLDLYPESFWIQTPHVTHVLL